MNNTEKASWKNTSDMIQKANTQMLSHSFGILFCI